MAAENRRAISAPPRPQQPPLPPPLVASSKPLPAKLDDCLRSTLQTLELPPLGEGSAVEIDYPFTFRAVAHDRVGSGSNDEDDGDDDD